MHAIETFISSAFRPKVLGGTIDPEHEPSFQLTHEPKTKEMPTVPVNAICFGPKKDNVLITLEHAVNQEEDILIFYYEDIHLRWSYVSTNQESYFLYKKNEEEQYKIKPGYLYLRGCYVEPEDKYWFLLGDFFNFVAMWEGAVLCPPKNQMPNESKLFQINNSLRKSSEDNASVSLGHSVVIKGERLLKALAEGESYIVKSLSGVRSIVVDESDYKLWPSARVNNLPVLFQKKIEGNDLRVHVINKHFFAKMSHAKGQIDYRYDANFFKLLDVENLEDALANFCLSVAKEEDNELLGLDFIKTSAGYVTLEANPSPGWSAYHPFNGMDDEPFITELLGVLKSASQ